MYFFPGCFVMSCPALFTYGRKMSAVRVFMFLENKDHHNILCITLSLMMVYPKRATVCSLHLDRHFRQSNFS